MNEKNQQETTVENFEFRMENWVRWAGHFGVARGSCQSIEKKYRHVQHWEAIDKISIPIDERDGEFIESCIVALPETDKIVVVSEYYYRADRRATSRRCFIGWGQYDGVLKEAKEKLKVIIVLRSRRK